MEASTIVVILGFFVLGVLSLLSWREIRRDFCVARTWAERCFLKEESRRQLLKTCGWFLLFGALMGRIFTEGVAWDVATVIVAAASVLSFLADGLLGRYYRRRWLGRS